MFALLLAFASSKHHHRRHVTPHARHAPKIDEPKPIFTPDEVQRILEVIAQDQQTNGLNQSIPAIVWTILFKGGEVKHEIDDISDAIQHGRSGCGLAVPSGKGLAKEMIKDKSYKKQVSNNDSPTATAIVAAVKKANARAGNLDIDIPGVELPIPVLSCQTLGNYVPKVHQADVDFTCDEKKHCSAVAKIHIAGTDPWDFDTNPGYSWFQNLIREKIPEFLVKLRGDFKPFDINYDLKDSVTYTFDL